MNEHLSFVIRILFWIILLFLSILVVIDAWKKLFGRFGRFTSAFRLEFTVVVEQCTIYVLSWRDNAQRTTGGLARAFVNAGVVNAEEDIMWGLRYAHDLPSGKSISSQVGKNRVITIDTRMRPPHEFWVTEIRTLERYELLACVDVECATGRKDQFFLAESSLLEISTKQGSFLKS